MQIVWEQRDYPTRGSGMTGPGRFKIFSLGREGGAGDSDDSEIKKVLIQVELPGKTAVQDMVRHCVSQCPQVESTITSSIRLEHAER